MTAVSTSTNITAAQFSGINYSGALTPDALLAYCRSRLSGFDTQMQAEFKKQEAYNTATKSINDAQRLLASATNGMSNAQGQAVLADYDAAIKALPDGPEKQKIQDQRNYFNTELNNDKDAVSVNGDQCKAYSDTCGDISKEMGQSAELDMMTLQSMMSQRQTAVQMCTNMIGSVGDTSKAIAEKIGS